MRGFNIILAFFVVIVFSLASVSDIDAKRRKKRRKKRRRKAKIEKVVAPTPKVSVEIPPDAQAEPQPSVESTAEPPPAPVLAAEPPATKPPVVDPSPVENGSEERTAPGSTVASESPPAVDQLLAGTTASGPIQTEMEIIEAAPNTGHLSSVERSTPEPSGESNELFPVTAAFKLGTVIPSMMSPLEAALFGTIEAGYMLPFLGQRLVLLADFSYSRPEYIDRYTFSDLRLPSDGSYRYRIVEDQYSIGLGVLVRVFTPRSVALFGLNFYAKLTGRLELQHAAEGAKAVTAFGKNEEIATRGAVLFGGGAEFAIGPGALLVELNFAWAPLEHQITGNVGTGGLGVMLGYALLIGG